MARRSKYNPDTFPLLAEGYARQGLIDTQIAKNLGIGKTTFYIYEQKHAEFREAIMRGKMPVDFEVENSLLKIAKGFKHEETTKIMTLDQDDNPKVKELKSVSKYIPPNERAIEFWLSNRNPERWKNKQSVEHSGEVKENHEITYSDLNDD
jgi:hypothetical protein